MSKIGDVREAPGDGRRDEEGVELLAVDQSVVEFQVVPEPSRKEIRGIGQRGRRGKCCDRDKQNSDSPRNEFPRANGAKRGGEKQRDLYMMRSLGKR